MIKSLVSPLEYRLWEHNNKKTLVVYSLGSFVSADNQVTRAHFFQYHYYIDLLG